MKKDKGATIYAGVNFVVTPFVDLTLDNRIELQKRLEELGINLTNISFENQVFVANHTAPTSLEVRIAQVIPQQISQIVIVAPNIISKSLEFLAAESCAIIEVFKKIWPNRQVVNSDATVRYLFESSSDHAFKELWEDYLEQPAENLSAFKRPVLGGGLRFVMPSNNEDPSTPSLVEVKIESFLPDSKKIFVEVSSFWQQPQGSVFNPDKKLEYVEQFIQNEVMDFISKGKGG